MIATAKVRRAASSRDFPGVEWLAGQQLASSEIRLLGRCVNETTASVPNWHYTDFGCGKLP